MSIQPDKFLLPEADGLPTRTSGEYVVRKLRALSRYIEKFTTSMREKKWRALRYIDLQAGPGKNHVDGHTYFLGSPLLALHSRFQFTDYIFNEKDKILLSALQQRSAQHPLYSKIRFFQEDMNTLVSEVCAEIEAQDKKYLPGQWPSLNFAFLDPEGLELAWTTVESLAQIKRMDLMINFSTSGLIRNAPNAPSDSVLDRFFGTQDWREHYKAQKSAAENRRALIDFYLSRLEPFGYVPFEKETEIVVKNANNAQLYTLIFASKNQLGNDFWEEIVRIIDDPRLPGF
jgi:three-Cys-motif partner protein